MGAIAQGYPTARRPSGMPSSPPCYPPPAVSVPASPSPPRRSPPPHSATTGRVSTFTALRTPPFRIVWIGTWLSFTAFFMSTVVNSVVAFELTGFNTAVGWVVFAQGWAMLMLSPVGGALADRLPKRRVVVGGQLVTTTVFASLALLYASGHIAVVFLAMAAFVMGLTFAFIGPARQALVVDLVPGSVRGNAIALSQVANTGSRVLGPSAAGLFLAWEAGGPAAAYAAMAGLYVVSAGLLALLPRSRVPEGAGERGLFEDVMIGLRYVAHTPRLRTILVFYTLVIMLGFPHITVLPGLVENQLGRDASEVPKLFTASALGAVAAALAAARIADSPRAPLYFVGAGALFGASLLGLGEVPSFEWAMVAMFGIGAGSGGFQALGAASAAHASDPAFIGRVLSLTMLAFAGFGIVGLPIGWLADQVGERQTMLGMGTTVLVLVVVLALRPAVAAEPRGETPQAGAS